MRCVFEIAGRGFRCIGDNSYLKFGLLLICLAASFFSACRADIAAPADDETQNAIASEVNPNAELQVAAERALKDYEGTIILMNADDGAVRAVVNPRMAAEHAFPPGSAIKPFTLLAALRSGIVGSGETDVCRSPYRTRTRDFTCTHAPTADVPLSLEDALAFSCNSRFARIAERISESVWRNTLAPFGFGRRTGADFGGEARGRFDNFKWSPAVALGDNENLQVTAVQLAVAYAAFANGGHRVRPHLTIRPNGDETSGRNLDFAPPIGINAEHRALITRGMRGCIERGTAKNARLADLPLEIYGKTGTSTASNDFRRQGWFVALTGNVRTDNSQFVFTPSNASTVIVVLLRRASGVDAAQVARPVLETYARLLINGNLDNKKIATLDREDAKRKFDARLNLIDESVRVKVESDKRNSQIKTLSLDDYIVGVLAAEASIETESEALKAQAITSRTYALRNRGRHAAEGFDYCSTTHCQHFILPLDSPIKGLSTRGSSRADSSLRTRRDIVRQTARQVLLDADNRVVEAVFHASCGGATTSLEAAWNVVPAPVYLRGVTDEACASDRRQAWISSIPRRDIARALRRYAATDVGVQATDINIVKRDATGRIERLRVGGDKRQLNLNGWDFKIAVGRALGWNKLKSTLFDVESRGDDFVFRGRGNGHGLGLCQTGTHSQAQRGANANAILAHYFPNTRIVRFASNESQTNIESSATRTLRSPNFRVFYSNNSSPAQAASVLRELETARARLLARLAVAGETIIEPSTIDVRIHASTGDFAAQTRHGASAAAATIDGVIHTQPLAILQARNILTRTLRHEVVHAVINQINPRAVRWITEGAAIHFAGEARFYASTARLPIDDAELNRRLAHPRDAAEMKNLYAYAYKLTRETFLQRGGETFLWQAVLQN